MSLHIDETWQSVVYEHELELRETEPAKLLEQLPHALREGLVDRNSFRTRAYAHAWRPGLIGDLLHAGHHPRVAISDGRESHQPARDVLLYDRLRGPLTQLPRPRPRALGSRLHTRAETVRGTLEKGETRLYDNLRRAEARELPIFCELGARHRQTGALRLPCQLELVEAAHERGMVGVGERGAELLAMQGELEDHRIDAAEHHLGAALVYGVVESGEQLIRSGIGSGHAMSVRDHPRALNEAAGVRGGASERPAVARERARSDQRAAVLRLVENQGAHAARNVSAALARGTLATIGHRMPPPSPDSRLRVLA